MNDDPSVLAEQQPCRVHGMEVTLRHRRPSEVKMATPGREMNASSMALVEEEYHIGQEVLLLVV